MVRVINSGLVELGESKVKIGAPWLNSDGWDIFAELIEI